MQNRCIGALRACFPGGLNQCRALAKRSAKRGCGSGSTSRTSRRAPRSGEIPPCARERGVRDAPWPTFVKTFLRTYAEMLGLDPHVLVEEYRANYEHEDELEFQPLGPPGVSGRERYRGPRVGPGALALLVLVGSVAVLVAIGLASDEGRWRRQAAAHGDNDRADHRAGEEAAGAHASCAADGAGDADLGVRGPRPGHGGVVREHDRQRPALPRKAPADQSRQAGRPARDERQARGGHARPGPGGFAFTPRHVRELPSGERPCLATTLRVR